MRDKLITDNTSDYIVTLNTYIKLLENKNMLLEDKNELNKKIKKVENRLNNISKCEKKIKDEINMKACELQEKFLNNSRIALQQNKLLNFQRNIHTFCQIKKIRDISDIEEYSFWNKGKEKIEEITTILTVIEDYKNIITLEDYKKMLKKITNSFFEIKEKEINLEILISKLELSKYEILNKEEWIKDYIYKEFQELLNLSKSTKTITSFVICANSLATILSL